MLNLWEPNSLSYNKPKVCPNKPPKQVLLSYLNSAGPFTTLSGTVQFQKRLDYVIQCRVNKISISSPAGVTLMGGYAIYFSSSRLGGLIGQTPFVTAIGTNTSTLVAFEQSNIIGMSDLAQLNLANNAEPASRSSQINPILPFITPSPIESFDWQVGLINGALTLTAAYTVEIEIEFYQACRCSQ